MNSRGIRVPDDLAERLESRAENEGADPSALAERALREFLDRDPLGFVGLIDSPQLRGADVDSALAEEGFGV
jgi:hypothetical protein